MMIYLPPFYEPDVMPVYKVGHKFYDITTLKVSKYKAWSDQALFGIPFNPFRVWIHQPILVRTKYGGFILEIPEEGKLNISSVPVKKSLCSPFLSLYLIKIPETELSPPDTTMFQLLEGFIGMEMSLQEYLGHIPVQDNCLKVSFNEMIELSGNRYIQDLDFVPKFKKTESYGYANVVLIAKLKGGQRCITLATKDAYYSDVRKMPIGNL